LAGSALNLYLAAVQGYDVFCNTEPQTNPPCAAPVSGVKPVERIKYCVQFMLRDADALIDDKD
jgi:hypothetical protein